jgi:predicted TIM-barrel fold metal-dependent hydrolase
LLLTIWALGIDNVLFAADYPFETVRDSLEAVDNLAIADRDSEKHLSRNAQTRIQAATNVSVCRAP